MILIFENVLRMSVSAAFVILAVMAARLLLHSSPKKYSYALWSVVLFRMCCPVSFSSGFSFGTLVNKVSNLFTSVSNGNTEISKVPTQSPAVDVFAPTTTAPLVSVPSYDAGTVQTAPTPSVTVDGADALSFTDVLPYLIFAVWVLGVVLMLAWWIFSYMRIYKYTKDARLSEHGVYESGKVPSPFVLGYIRPKIYIPCGLDSETLPYVISHEKIHIRRLDHIIKSIFYAALSLHWFNPMCWIAFILMSRDMEMSCDEKVLSSTGYDRKEYSMALLKIASMKRHAVPSPVGFGEVGVKKRINHALNYRKPKTWVTVLSLMLCVVTLFGCASDAEIENTDQTTENVQTGENETETSEVVDDEVQITELDDAVSLSLIKQLEEGIEGYFLCESHHIFKTVENAEDNTVSVLVLRGHSKTYEPDTGLISDWRGGRAICIMKFLKTENGYEELLYKDNVPSNSDDIKQMCKEFFAEESEETIDQYVRDIREVIVGQTTPEMSSYRYAIDGKLYEIDNTHRYTYFETQIANVLDSNEDYEDPEGYIIENRAVFDNLVLARDVEDFLIEEFLKGGNDDLRGFVMYRALSEYMANNEANEYTDEAFDFVPLDENGKINGQFYFDTLLKHIIDLRAEYGVAQLNGKYPTWVKIINNYMSSLTDEEYLNLGSPYPVPDAITVHHNGESITFSKGEGKYYDIYRFNTGLSVACDKTLNSDIPMNGYKMVYLCDTPDYESLISEYSVFEIETYPYIEYVYDDGTPGCIFAARGGAILVPLMDKGEDPLYAAYHGWIHHGSMGELLESCFE